MENEKKETVFGRVFELWFENRVVLWVCEFWNYDLKRENLFGYEFWIYYVTYEMRKVVWFWILKRVFKT